MTKKNNRGDRKGGLGTLIKIAYRNIWRNKRRTLFCISAAGVAVFMIVFYQAFIDGFSRNINDIVQIFDLGHVKVVSAQYEAESEYMPVQYPVLTGEGMNGENTEELIRRIKELPAVNAVFPRISTAATLQESTIKHALLWGISAEEETAYNNFNLSEKTDGLVAGRFPAPGTNECAIGFAFAEKSGFTIGDRIVLKTVSAQFSDKFWDPEIVGIFNFEYAKIDNETIIVDFERLQRLLVMGNGTQQLVIFADDEKQSPVLVQEIKGLAGEGNIVTEWNDNYWVAVMEAAKPLYGFIYFIFLLVASFLIINTMLMIIHERTKEIGMMGSLGMTRAEIVAVFFFESLFLSAIGAFAGVILGGLLTVIGQYFPLRWTALTGNTFNEFPAGNVLFLGFSVASLFRSWLMGVVIASLFTLIPSLKSAFVQPVEALRR
jgi:putative ABC transport system permease protein